MNEYKHTQSMLTTTHTYRDYVFTVKYTPERPAYTVDFPDFSDIITSGETLHEAFANACEALDLHLESLEKLGHSHPKPKHRLVVETA